jgi:endonuclease/exonuclease/phosphatase family metal-dependent hydrolase/2'-5' RNA ligase
MKTSEDIYNRILTDSQFNACNFTITHYDAIKDKYIDTPILQWKSIKNGGDIPWTRVYYIKYKGRPVWDRKEALCDLSDCTEEKQTLQSNLKIVTFNVLSDEYDKQITNLNKRLDKIMNYITNCGFDIICLQEVTAQLYAELLKTEYITNITSVGRNDVVIMSKIQPTSVKVIELGPSKQALKTEFLLENSKVLIVIGIHLTSDTNRNASVTRTQQINKIKLHCQNDDVVILGDTNEVLKIDLLNDFKECHTGPTYNPELNPFAKKFSQKGIKSRYDRIYYKGCLKNTLVGVIENNILSDHYAVEANFSYDIDFVEQQSTSIKKTQQLSYKTALCIVPPFTIKKELPQYNLNWMPHINIFWGFVGEHEFNHYYKLFKQVKFEEFELTFDKYDCFEHDNKITVFLSPTNESAQKIINLRNKYISLFPAINGTYTPHLSLYTINNKEKYSLPILSKPVSFLVNSVCFCSRENSDVIEIKRIISTQKTSINEVVNYLNNFDCDVNICGSAN